MGTRKTLQSLINNQFYQMPTFLFQGKFQGNAISCEARCLYSLLLNRFNLSINNTDNGWVNEKGEVYLVYTRKDIQDILGLCKETTIKVFKELKDLGLIEEERLGQGKPNRIYICEIEVDTDLTYKKKEISTDNNSSGANTKNEQTQPPKRDNGQVTSAKIKTAQKHPLWEYALKIANNDKNARNKIAVATKIILQWQHYKYTTREDLIEHKLITPQKQRSYDLNDVSEFYIRE